MQAAGKLLLVYFAIACCGSGTVVRAQQHDDVAQALFDSGREALRGGDYQRACQFFRDSDQLEPAPGTKLNLADCEERRGRLATAWQLFRRLAASLPVGDSRIAVARDRAGALEARLSKLTVELAAAAPAATTIRVDGVSLPTAKIGVPLVLDPGEHEIVTSALGRLARSQRIRLEPGENRSLELAPGATTGVALDQLDDQKTRTTGRDTAITQRWWFWTGAGAAIVAGAAAALAIALSGGSSGQAPAYQGNGGSLHGP